MCMSSVCMFCTEERWNRRRDKGNKKFEIIKKLGTVLPVDRQESPCKSRIEVKFEASL